MRIYPGTKKQAARTAREQVRSVAPSFDSFQSYIRFSSCFLVIPVNMFAIYVAALSGNLSPHAPGSVRASQACHSMMDMAQRGGKWDLKVNTRVVDVWQDKQNSE